jgi:hypothetical protein
MQEQTHTGARPFGPLTRSADRRILELDDFARVAEVTAQTRPFFGMMRDSHRAGQATQSALNSGDLLRGIIVHSIPGIHWYKVQLGQGQGWIAACMLSDSGLIPVGPRNTSPIPPNNSVLVYKPKGLNHGYILGVIPPALANGNIVCPDWIVQGSGSGLRREAAHLFPITSTTANGGAVDWSANRPLDSTSMERGWTTPTGLAVTIDDFLIQLRVNEQCGLWMSIFDSWCRLAGVQLDIESSVHGEYARDDEGESRHLRAIAAYPWEALGLYDSGTAFTQDYDGKDVQYTKHKAAIDLPEGKEDVQPIYRYLEHGGYLGQGHLRAVVKPAKVAGVQRYSDQDIPDEGVFRETIGLDGSYSLVSAKRVYIGKRCKIVIPKAVKAAEDGRGDDALKDNYLFSGKFGSAEPHKISDIKITVPHQAMLRCAAVNDLIAHTMNWQALHPFHYHKLDFKTWQLDEQDQHFNRIQEHLDFTVLADESAMTDPIAISMHIDHRYGDVDYFERESFLIFHDDGSVQLGCGYGAQILLAEGNIRIQAPGTVAVEAGTDAIMLADQIILRAKDSIDVSSSQRDVRIKAERNMQLLAGNSGQGGMLLESKGTGSINNYAQLFGEDVQSSGIVLKAAEGTCAVLAQNIYLRTGGADLGEGDILLDASGGQRDIRFYADEIHAYANSQITFAFGPQDDVSVVNRLYTFKSDVCIIDVPLELGGQLRCYSAAGILSLGEIVSTACIIGEQVASADGSIGFIAASFFPPITAALTAVSAVMPGLRSVESTVHQDTIVLTYYQTTQLGDFDTITNLGFSYRDPPGAGIQYKTESFTWPEARWQMLQRLGLASGGVVWAETPVLYQGELTYPWPGKQQLTIAPSFLQLAELTMFGVSAGQDLARPGPYEQPQLGDLKANPMQGNYKLNR